MILEAPEHTSLKAVREHLCIDEDQPNWIYVFAWQTPLMFLCYAIVFYLAGLTSYIVSPVARDFVWDDNAKVSRLSSCLLCLLIYR